MSDGPATRLRLPPQLSMDDYVTFVAASIRDATPALVVRQKRLEKRIRKPFRLEHAGTPLPTRQ